MKAFAKLDIYIQHRTMYNNKHSAKDPQKFLEIQRENDNAFD